MEWELLVYLFLNSFEADFIQELQLKLTISVKDKRLQNNTFQVPRIICHLYKSNNTPAAPAYQVHIVYISQLVRYSRLAFPIMNPLIEGCCLQNSYWSIISSDKSRKYYDHHHESVDCYKISVYKDHNVQIVVTINCLFSSCITSEK